MFGLPMEVISMIFSTIMGAWMKMKAQDQADKAEQQKMLLEMNKAQEASIAHARKYDNPSAAWTRRFIVICLMVFAGIILIAPILFGHGTNVLTETTHGWKFLFLDSLWTEMEWKELAGVVTPDWLPYAIMNILGFYFGTSAASRR